MNSPRRIALMVGGHTTFGRGIIRGVVQYCQEHGPWDIHIESSQTRDNLVRLGHMVAQWKPAGVVAEIWTREQLHVMQAYSVPVVEISGSWESGDVANLHLVHSDNQAVGQLAARHLLERGLKYFAYYGRSYLLHSQQRKASFVAELAKAGFGCQTRDISRPNTIKLREEEHLIKWLRALNTPVGLMCYYDSAANDVVHACRRAAIRIPEDVALVGVGNDDFVCDIAAVPISSVDLSPIRTGYVAASLIASLGNGRKPPKKPILIEPVGLVVRQSSDIRFTPNQYVADAIRYIQEHACSPITIADVLEHVPISRRWMETHFKSLLGRTPEDHLYHVRVEMAKRLLLETDLSLETIALRTGFKGAPIFSTIFLRKTGHRPGAYRREFRQGGQRA